MDFLRNVNHSSRIEINCSTACLEVETKTILRQYEDQVFNLVDADSFALMREPVVKIWNQYSL